MYEPQTVLCVNTRKHNHQMLLLFFCHKQNNAWVSFRHSIFKAFIYTHNLPPSIEVNGRDTEQLGKKTDEIEMATLYCLFYIHVNDISVYLFTEGETFLYMGLYVLYTWVCVNEGS